MISVTRRLPDLLGIFVYSISYSIYKQNKEKLRKTKKNSETQKKKENTAKQRKSNKNNEKQIKTKKNK